MMGKRSGANFIAVSLAVVSFCLVALDVKAEEVGKGEIPVAHLDRSLKTLPWEVAILGCRRSAGCTQRPQE
jgi:hypothetical protein